MTESKPKYEAGEEAAPSPSVALKDGSNDRKYRIEVPQIVWARCKSVYELSLWNTVKMIAGEEGECFLSTEDLAAAAMMSTGKCVECRKSLLSKGLLVGELRKDPGYPQPVWHLTVPDLWEVNIRWRQKHNSLTDRIADKWKQRKKDKSLHRVKASLDEEGPSPGEGEPSQGEEGPSPGEAKKEPKEETRKNNPKKQPTPAASAAVTPETQQEKNCPECGNPKQTGSEARHIWDCCTCEQEAVLDEVFGDGGRMRNVADPVQAGGAHSPAEAVVDGMCRYNGLSQGIAALREKDRKAWMRKVAEILDRYDVTTKQARLAWQAYTVRFSFKQQVSPYYTSFGSELAPLLAGVRAGDITKESLAAEAQERFDKGESGVDRWLETRCVASYTV